MSAAQQKAMPTAGYAYALTLPRRIALQLGNHAQAKGISTAHHCPDISSLFKA
ncbi:MAG: hypothetical protein ACFKPT_02430 [Gloeotrichia echinulata GP01]